MATCNKGSSYVSTKRGVCSCIADGMYQCADGTRWLDAGSSADTAENIAQQDKVRAQGLPPWAPWAIGGLALGGLAWFFLRK